MEASPVKTHSRQSLHTRQSNSHSPVQQSNGIYRNIRNLHNLYNYDYARDYSQFNQVRCLGVK